jgi:hypothetical protein
LINKRAKNNRVYNYLIISKNTMNSNLPESILMLLLAQK